MRHSHILFIVLAALALILTANCNVPVGNGPGPTPTPGASPTPTVDPNCTDIDQDGYCNDVDCDDFAALTNPGATEECADGTFDEDCDGLSNCGEDPDCEGDPVCNVVESESGLCDNGTDDDSDGAADCYDFDCFDDPICGGGGNEICDDGVDNDGDVRVDCVDPDCALIAPCVGETDCQDGIDNEPVPDGQIDCFDPECFSDPNCSLFSVPDCCDIILNPASCTADPACPGEVCADPVALVLMLVAGEDCCNGAWSGYCSWLALGQCTVCAQ